MIDRRFVAVKRSGSTRSALSGSRANCSITPSISSALRTCAANGFIDNNGASSLDCPRVQERCRIWVKEICDSPDLWSDTFHQFKPLTGHGWLEIREAGEIATWPRQALHHTRGDRVADLYKNRGRRAGGFPDRGSDRRRIGKDHIRAQVEQLFGELARMRYVAATPAVDELDITAL